jgi:hypothetical protein
VASSERYVALRAEIRRDLLRERVTSAALLLGITVMAALCGGIAVF